MSSKPLTLPLVTVGYFLWASSGLFEEWYARPYDRFGWLAFLCWLAPLFYFMSRGQLARGSQQEYSLWFGAIGLGLIGTLADLNCAYHLALALIVVGLVPWRTANLIWLLSAIAWMPVLELVLPLPSPHLSVVRVSVASAASASTIFVLPKGTDGFGATADRTSVRTWAWVALSATVVLTWIWPNMAADEFGSSFVQPPLVAEDYVSAHVAIEPSERLSLSGELAMRRYVRSGQHRFVLTIVDASSSPHSIHHPSVCLGGRGWQSRGASKLETDAGPVAMLTVERDAETRQILYWFSERGRWHASFFRYRFGHFMRRLQFGRQGQGPVFVTVNLIAGSDEEAVDLLETCSVFSTIQHGSDCEDASSVIGPVQTGLAAK